MTSTPFPVTNQSPPVTKVLVVDDHAAIIEMMTNVIDLLDGFSVVGTALDAESALTICRSQPVDLIVLDLVLPGISGLSLLEQISSFCPKVRVLIFTGNLTTNALRGAVAAGVLGVVEKMAPLAIFRDALRSVALGRTYFGPLAGQLIKDLVVRNPSGAPEREELTKREKTVLSHVARGLSSKEIADKMGLSVHTIMNHRSNLMKKTGLHRVAQLSLYAAQTGLIGETVR